MRNLSTGLSCIKQKVSFQRREIDDDDDDDDDDSLLLHFTGSYSSTPVQAGLTS